MKKINFMTNCRLQKLAIAGLFFFAILSISGCSDDPAITDDHDLVEDANFVPTDWTEATHSKSADPDFDEVFNNQVVNRLDLVIDAGLWEAMLEDMTGLYGTFGSSGSSPGGPGNFSDEDPIFVTADLFYKGRQWYKVGVRFKGNSSLASSWQQGILKLSLKLDFDEYEDDYPQIDNQRFYGFKKLSLKNNFDDQSFLREKVAADVFADAGLEVSHTAFYTLFIDSGEGPVYFGLYTLVEEVDDTVIETQFASDEGNLYKPENYGASFEAGSFNEAGFEKKSNEDEADWSDIQALFEVLHDDYRITDPSSWRNQLETIFDTETFLHYLAVNTVIQNWDSYGIMAQNYYLYNNPENGKLTWIPWDHNEALQDGKMGGSLNIDFSNLDANAWPLIGYLYADEKYKRQYDAFVKNTVEEVFNPERMVPIYSQYAEMIEPYATAETSGYSFLQSEEDFHQAITLLKQQVENRRSVAESYLD